MTIVAWSNLDTGQSWSRSAATGDSIATKISEGVKNMAKKNRRLVKFTPTAPAPELVRPEGLSPEELAAKLGRRAATFEGRPSPQKDRREARVAIRHPARWE